MDIVLQKTHTLGLICLSEKDYEALPSDFMATVIEPKMSKKQRGALHVWCGQVAEVLNDNCFWHEVLHPFTKEILEWKWEKETVKAYLYKPTLKAYKGKISTEEQDRVEPSLIAEVLSISFAKTKGITLPMWPSRLG